MMTRGRWLERPGPRLARRFEPEPIVFDRDTAHCLSSVAKSFTATLLGLAIEHGFIASVDQRALELFPELGDLNVGQKRDITLEHLATMTSGLEWDESSYSLRDSRNDLTAWLNLARTTPEDPVRAVFERPMVATPGTVLNYGGGNTNVVGKAIQEASGLRLDAFAREYLFAPMGIEDVLPGAAPNRVEGRLVLGAAGHARPLDAIPVEDQAVIARSEHVAAPHLPHGHEVRRRLEAGGW